MGATDPSETPDEPPAEQEIIPFYDVQTLEGMAVHVQAGWIVDGEVDELTINATPLDPSSAMDQIQTAHGWWMDRWNEIFQQQAAQRQAAQAAQAEAAEE